MIEVSESTERKLDKSNLINGVWTRWDNEKWARDIPDEIGMFRKEDESARNSPIRFPDYYRSLQSEFIEKNGRWIQKVKSEENTYEAKARILRSGVKIFGREIPTGKRVYDPEKPNFIYHHWASAMNPDLHTAAIKAFSIPELTNFNVINITAHGHSATDADLPGNAMTRAFPTMESIQGTLAASAMLTENIAKNSTKPTVYMGISMGGIAGLWGDILNETDLEKSFIVAAHTEYRQVFFNEEIRGLISGYNRKKASLSSNNSLLKRDLTKDDITQEVRERCKDIHIFYGTKDKTVNPEIVEENIRDLGIQNTYQFPYDHKFMGRAFGRILEVVRKELEGVE